MTRIVTGSAPFRSGGTARAAFFFSGMKDAVVGADEDADEF